jgi:hypothetical protein
MIICASSASFFKQREWLVGLEARHPGKKSDAGTN